MLANTPTSQNRKKKTLLGKERKLIEKIQNYKTYTCDLKKNISSFLWQIFATWQKKKL
jgi:hypothetical protein